MSIKKLQNNFTTPEQSKRLLELGVPADSADCIWYNPYYDGDRPELAEISVWKGKYPQRVDKYTFPCWSVGRLIEIITICREEIYTRLLFSRVDDHTNIENLIHYISAEIENGHIDFSKLED